MLVLSRKPGEKVVIGGNITITVVDVNCGRTRIGIEAPADVIILRDELVAVQEGRGLAAGMGSGTPRPLELDVNGGQESSAIRPEPMPVVAIKAPLRRLRKVPR